MLPIFGKIFEKVVFNRIYNFLLNQRLLNPNQFGFPTSNSCIKQLLAITHEICESFDCNPSLEVRSVFVDISKVFDKVWHKGVLYKLKSIRISGDLNKLIENYLSGRFQRVILNGQTSSWRPILAGVPQGSTLGPRFFFIYIIDLPKALKTTAKLFANDTTLFTIVKDNNESANALNNAVIKKLRHTLQRSSLFKIYRVFLRHLIDYGDNTIYDHPHNSSFCEKLESVQYKAVLAITGAIQDTSRKKIFQELILESLKS